MTDREFIEAVKEAADILQVMAERGVNLRRSGRRWVGLCPFHRERTPSFYVDPDLGLYHCFGCGASGDVIRFVMEKDGLSFREALELLAQKFGVPIPERRDQGPDPGARALAFAAGFYSERLLENEEILKYLNDRGFDAEDIMRFNLGYAPPGPDALLVAARRVGIGAPELLAAGLAHRREDGTWVDIFRNRLMFPIHSVSGRMILGFGGRLMGGEGPKYLNSPETERFKKGNLLYGLHLARGHMRREGVAYLVEGYLDVMAMHRAGLGATVAPLGTALTEAQARLLAKYADTVVLVFDGDEAGVRAAKRSLGPLLAANLLVRVALLPPGEDPADLVAQGRESELRERVGDAMELADFFVMGQDLTDTRVKRNLAREARALLAGVGDPVLREIYTSGLAEVLGLSAGSLRAGQPKAQTQRSSPDGEAKIMAWLILHSQGRPWSQLLEVWPDEALGPTARKLLVAWREGGLARVSAEPELAGVLMAASSEWEGRPEVELDIKLRLVYSFISALSAALAGGDNEELRSFLLRLRNSMGKGGRAIAECPWRDKREELLGEAMELMLRAISEIPGAPSPREAYRELVAGLEEFERKVKEVS